MVAPTALDTPSVTTLSSANESQVIFAPATKSPAEQS